MLGRTARLMHADPERTSPKGVDDMRNQRTPWLVGRILIRAALAMLVVASAAGPAIGASPPDTLIWDIAAGPQYVDPVMGTAAQANVMVVQSVYERLVWYDRASTQPI